MHEDYNPTGYDFICGSDEAGLGSWAGPLMVAAVMVPVDWVPPLGLTDSKQLTEAQRETLFLALQNDTRIRYQVRSVPSHVIDDLGIFQVVRAQHEDVHQTLRHMLDPRERALFIADGTFKLNHNIRSLPKADTFVPAVSAASILAKVTHDREMVLLAQTYVGYGFERHKGYGTKGHEEALRKLGPCAAHRKSYGPIVKFQKPDPVPDIFADFEELDS